MKAMFPVLFSALLGSTAALAEQQCSGPVLLLCEMSSCAPVEPDAQSPMLTLNFDNNGNYKLCRDEKCSSDTGEVYQQNGSFIINKETRDPNTNEKTAFISIVLNADNNKAVVQTHEFFAELACE